jgi:hypothetical protein
MMMRAAQRRSLLRPNDGDMDMEVQSGPSAKTLVLCVGLCLVVLMAAISQNLPALSSLASGIAGGADRVPLRASLAGPAACLMHLSPLVPQAPPRDGS